MKRKSKSWSNVSFKTWAYKKQTEMKHQFLKDYVPTWLQILGKFNKKLNYIDGFGGIGAYHVYQDLAIGKYISNNFGSPIFTIERIIEVQKKISDLKANVLILDINKNNLININGILKHKGLDRNERINITLHEADFDKKINNLLDSLEPTQELAPTFFLIDPFGFSLKMETIKRIMGLPKSEVIVNFMYNAIQRWTSSKQLEITFTELFGTEDWKKYADEATLVKEKALVNLFKMNCKKFSKYVFPFRLKFPIKNRPYYYLFHLTNHIKGLRLSKEIFARHNAGELEYRGTSYNYSFNDLLEATERSDYCYRCYLVNKNDSRRKCSQCIKEVLKNQKNISYENFISKIYDDIPQTEKNIRICLRKLEENGEIKVKPSPTRKGKRRAGFEDNDLLVFVKKH